jgi:hypothetical protein
MNKILFTCFLLLFYSILFGQVVLKPSEQLICSFETTGKKTVLIVIDTVKYKVIYRYGTKDKTELEIIHDTISGHCDVADTDEYRNTFSYNFYDRSGGAANLGMEDFHFEFINNGFFYNIFSEYYAVGNSTSIGIRVTNLSSKKETDIEGKLKTEKGSLEDGRLRKYVLNTYGEQ